MSDLISRQQAIDAMAELQGRASTKAELKGISKAWKRIKQLPSVQPEREKGEWVYNSPVTMKCNRCGLVIKDWDWQRFKICPNCGADMRGEKDG